MNQRKYTFLTPEAQLHVSQDHFIPISRALGVPLPKEDFQMEPVETPAVPIPAWEPPVDMACDSGRVGSENPEEDTKEKGLFRRLFGKSSKSEKPRSEAEIKTADPVEAVEEGPEKNNSGRGEILSAIRGEFCRLWGPFERRRPLQPGRG